MKNITQVLTKIEELKDLDKAIRESNPDVEILTFKDIKDVPLKILIKLSEKFEAILEYGVYSKVLTMRLSNYNKDHGVSVNICSVEVEKTFPDPKPITLDQYKEIKPKR